MPSGSAGGAPSDEVTPVPREYDLSGARELPRTRISVVLDRIVEKIGDWVSWLWLVLVVIIVVNVTMRYLFGEGRIEFEELQWHFYAVGFLVGLSYCVISDTHVRVDVLHTGFSLRKKAWIELFGILLFLLPFVILVLNYAVPFILRSWEAQEVSDAPGGLPYRWAIKSFLFTSFVLLFVATFARLTRVTAFLFRFPAPLSDTGGRNTR